jgi:hypothetical protein
LGNWRQPLQMDGRHCCDEFGCNLVSTVMKGVKVRFQMKKCKLARLWHADFKYHNTLLC